MLCDIMWHCKMLRSMALYNVRWQKTEKNSPSSHHDNVDEGSKSPGIIDI